MAEYIKQEMSDMDGSGKKRVFYRMRIIDNISTEAFIQSVAQPGSGLNAGEVAHVLSAVADRLAQHMGQGYTVSIDGLGTFRPTLGLVKGKEMDTLDGDEQKCNAMSIVVDGIAFKPEKELIRKTNRKCRLRRGNVSRLHRSPYTQEERLALAQKYLEEHPYMRISDYVALTKLGRTTATLELRAFKSVPENNITTDGRGSGKVYVKMG